MREVATATNDVAGDGTTTATVLAQAIVREGLKNVAAGANPMALKRGIETAVGGVVDDLKAQSKEVSGKEDIARVATISSREREIGDVIADAIEKVGKDGVVNVEEGQTFGLELEFTEGMQFDKGYLSPYMITDPSAWRPCSRIPSSWSRTRRSARSRTSCRCSSRSSRPAAAADRGRGRGGRVARHDRRQQAARHVHRRRRQGPGLRRPPQADARGHRHPAGGEVITEEMGLKLENTKLSQLGRARKVVIDKDSTTIIDGAGDPEQIKARIKQLKAEVENTDSDFDREKLQERLAKLAGGVAVVKVGAATETEMKEKKHRVEDALQATRAALEEGIVAGGGVALLNAAAPVKKSADALRATRRRARRSSCGRSRSRSASWRRTPGSRARSSSTKSATPRRGRA